MLQDPDNFIPDRFMEGTPESKAVNPDAWVPFGGGVRACVGEKFAVAVSTDGTLADAQDAYAGNGMEVGRNYSCKQPAHGCMMFVISVNLHVCRCVIQRFLDCMCSPWEYRKLQSHVASSPIPPPTDVDTLSSAGSQDHAGAALSAVHL